MIDRASDLQHAWEEENRRRPYLDGISVMADGSYLIILAHGERVGNVHYNDVTSPAKPWTVSVRRLRVLKFASVKSLMRSAFWRFDVLR